MPCEDNGKNVEDSDLKSKLFEALCNKDVAKAKEIVESNSKIKTLDFVDKDELSPLQHACHIGDVELARYLLDHGASVDYTNRKDGYTPLMFAAISSKEGVVRLLLERGVDTTKENCVNRTAAQMAAFVGLHRITGIINAWKPYHLSVEPYTRCRELEDKPRIPSEELGRVLHKLIVINNAYPIRVFLHIKENLDLVKYGQEFKYVLENLSLKASKSVNEEEWSFRYYYFSYFIDYCLKYYKANFSNNKDEPIDQVFDSSSWDKCILTIIRRFIKVDKSSKLEFNKFVVDCMMKFEFTHLPVYRTMTLALNHGKLDAVSAVIQILEGVRFQQMPAECCSVCNEAGKNKKCSKCKSVYYCGATCQHVDWFQHKKVCKSPEEKPLLKDTDDNV